jgi:hypothetical protein
MGRASIVPEIKAALEPWLEACMANWRAQPAGNRHPTLPITVDGKVNVRDLTRALGLKVSQEQHFYKHAELTQAVNAAAEEQGLRSIGSRAQIDVDDKAVADRLSRVRADRSDLARSLAEREAVIERLRRENVALRALLQLRDETGMVLRTGPIQIAVESPATGGGAR